MAVLYEIVVVYQFHASCIISSLYHFITTLTISLFSHFLAVQTTFLNNVDEYLQDGDDVDDIEFVFNEDFLSRMCPNLDGMAWSRGWTYNGGHGLAGLHAEDGLLHFGHVMVDVKLSFPFQGIIDYTGAVEESLNEQLVNIMQKLSSKVWVFHNKITSTENVIELNKLLGKLSGETSYVDELLVSREYVLDPRVFEDQPNWQVITQTAGEMVYGDSPHCVLGCGFFSVACNFAMKRSFLAYIRAEQRLATFVRKAGGAYLSARKRMNAGLPVAVRSFVFTSALFAYFLISCLKFDTYPSFILTSLRTLYQDDKQKHKQLRCPTELDDKEYLPVNSADRQCERCGAGYVVGLYALDGKGACVDCVLSEKKRKKYSFVSLFNGFLATATGLEQD
jgi:hypothetical protein